MHTSKFLVFSSESKEQFVHNHAECRSGLN